jgi:methyl-coenzyme M reductase beta subunit
LGWDIGNVTLQKRENKRKEEKKDMAKTIEDKIDLYDDRGNVLASDVPLQAISPLRNSAIKKIINLTIRTGAIDLAKLEEEISDRNNRRQRHGNPRRWEGLPDTGQCGSDKE